MSGETIKRGAFVTVRTADGRERLKRALSGVEGGSEHDFPIVWVCDVDEWRDDGQVERPMPWPVEDVRLASGEGSDA